MVFEKQMIHKQKKILYLRCSIVILGPNDQQHIHNDMDDDINIGW